MKVKRRSPARRGGRRDMSLVLADDGRNHGQPHAHAALAAPLLGGKIGIKDQIDLLRGYASTRVGKTEVHAGTRREPGGRGGFRVAEIQVLAGHPQRPAIGHGLPGVDRQVGEHLPHGVGIERHLPQLRRQIQFHAHRAARRRGHHRLPQRRADVAGQPGRPSALGEGDQQIRQLLGTKAGPFRVVQESMIESVGVHFVLHQADVSQNDRQQVVEVVGQAAGQHFHRLPFAGVHQLDFHQPLFREVDGDAAHETSPVRGRDGELVGHPELPAPVGSNEGFLKFQRSAFPNHPQVVPSESDGRVEGKKGEIGFAFPVGSSQAIAFLKQAIDEQMAAHGVLDEGQGRRVGHKCAEPFFAFPQGALDSFQGFNFFPQLAVGPVEFPGSGRHPLFQVRPPQGQQPEHGVERFHHLVEFVSPRPFQRSAIQPERGEGAGCVRGAQISGDGPQMPGHQQVEQQKKEGGDDKRFDALGGQHHQHPSPQSIVNPPQVGFHAEQAQVPKFAFVGEHQRKFGGDDPAVRAPLAGGGEGTGLVPCLNEGDVPHLDDAVEVLLNQLLV